MVRKNMIIFYNRGNYKIYELKGGEQFFLCISRGANHFLHVFQGGGEKIFNGIFLCLATYMSHYHCILPKDIKP